MRSGVPLIYQATFFDGRWQGRTDFLRRIEIAIRASAPYAYEVVDTKLARDVKPYVVHQLCLYNRLLAREAGVRARHCLRHPRQRRGGARSTCIAIARCIVHRRLLEQVVEASRRADFYPEPTAHCAICSLARECDAAPARRRPPVARRRRAARLPRERSCVGRSRPSRSCAGCRPDTACPRPSRASASRCCSTRPPCRSTRERPHLPTRRQLAARARSAATPCCPPRRPATSSSTSRAIRTSARTAASSTCGAGRRPTAPTAAAGRTREHEERAALCEFIEVVQAARAAASRDARLPLRGPREEQAAVAGAEVRRPRASDRRVAACRGARRPLRGRAPGPAGRRGGLLAEAARATPRLPAQGALGAGGRWLDHRV